MKYSLLRLNSVSTFSGQGHYPKKVPVIFLFIGALLSTIFQITYNSITISDEEEKIEELIAGKNTLLTENKALNKKTEL